MISDDAESLGRRRRGKIIINEARSDSTGAHISKLNVCFLSSETPELVMYTTEQ